MAPVAFAANERSASGHQGVGSCICWESSKAADNPGCCNRVFAFLQAAAMEVVRLPYNLTLRWGSRGRCLGGKSKQLHIISMQRCKMVKACASQVAGHALSAHLCPVTVLLHSPASGPL